MGLDCVTKCEREVAAVAGWDGGMGWVGLGWDWGFGWLCRAGYVCWMLGWFVELAMSAGWLNWTSSGYVELMSDWTLG